MKENSLRRSLLFVPADSERFIAKAESTCDLDGVILDLEDGVNILKKDVARNGVPEAVSRLKKSGKEVFVRINDLASLRGVNDLLYVAGSGLDGVLIPKADKDVVILCNLLLNAYEIENDVAKGTIRILVMIETAVALEEIDLILKSSERIDGVVFGAEDYTNDISVSKEDAAVLLDYARAKIVNSAKANDVQAIDSPCTDYKNAEVYTKEIVAAKRLGFSGKTTIHPSIVETINKEFSLSEEKRSYLERMISAFDQASKDGIGAISFEGSMVDKPIVDRARKLIRCYK